MTVYPSVWPLPYGITIPSEYSQDHYYAIPRSQTQCWAVKLGQYQQVKIVTVHNGIIGNQPLTIRAWMSQDPNGRDIIPLLPGVPSNIHLGFIGNSWNFHVSNIDPALIDTADVNYVMNPNLTYYFNLQNVENKDNSYYLRFTYMVDGTTLVL